MIGRNVLSPEGFVDGLEHDFFDAVHVNVIGPARMVMAGDSVLSRDGVMAMAGDAMDGMEGGAMDGMEDGAMDGMADGAMDGMAGMEGMEGMDEHHGFMVLQDPSSGQTIIEFTVPDKTGEWKIACFEDEGAHYDDGMQGTLKVVAS